MSSHKEFINEFMASTDPAVQQDAVSKLVDLLQNNTLTLLNFIQALQMYITSTNDTMRISTFTLLSQVLSKIPSTKLFPKDIEVLMAFLYSKLLDRPVIKYVLSCIFSLFTMKYFNSENSTELMQKLIDNYNPKENPQSIRLLALKIVNYQIESIPTQVYPNDLAIDCFLHVSQNEKDPNNLFLIFQILQKISKTLDITKYIQPLFDTMFRYYPIAFKSSNEAQKTQVNSLKDSLNTSLASNDLYAVELFPNLIEKYNSATSSQVKLDILATISVVAKLYSASVIQENFLSLWNTLKYTLINQELAQLVSIPAVMSYYEGSTNESDQIFHAALIAIQELATRVNDDSKLLVYDDLSKNLILSERNRRFLQSYLILAVISLPPSSTGATPENYDDEDDTLRKTLIQLFSSEQPLEQIKNKRMLLVALSYFASNSKFIAQLIPFRDDILNLLQSSLSSSALETTLRTLAVQSTSDLILAPSIISPSSGIEVGLLDTERSILTGKLGELLIENGLQSLRDFNTVSEKALLLALCKLSNASQCENDILNEVINNILLHVNKPELSLREKCILLNYLIKISQTSSLVQIVSIRLVNLLPGDATEQIESNIPVEIILQALTSLFISLHLTYDTNTITKKFLPLLFGFILKQTAGENDNSEIEISYICEIIRRMVVGLANEPSLNLVLGLFNVFNGIFKFTDIEVPTDDSLSSVGDIESLYFKSIKYDHIPILLYAIQGLDLEVNLKSKIDLISVLKTLIEILNIEGEDEIPDLTRIQLLVGISVLFNKYLSWTEFAEIFGESTSSELSSDETEIKVWALYGLILKCDSRAAEEFVNMLTVLDFEESSKAVDIIFTAVSEVSDKLIEEGEINLQHGLNIDVELLCAYKKERSTLMMVRNASKLAVSNLRLRHMWKQRILEILLSKKNNENSANMNVILPLILTYLPEELYTSHLEKLLPGLINTVESCDDESVIISVLKILCNVAVDDSGRVMLKPYLNSISEIVLSYVEEDKKKDVSKDLKKQSLRCLLGMCLFDLPVVIPFKKRVIQATQLGVSDKSRSVRLLAVSVRQAWEDLGVDLSM